MDTQALQQRAVKGATKAIAKAARPKRSKQERSTKIEREGVPVAEKVTISTSMPRSSISGKYTTHVLDIMPFQMKASNATYGDGSDFRTNSTAYRVFEYPLSPLRSDIYTTLAEKAKEYKEFSIRNLQVTYVPAVPTTTQGRYMLIYHPDAKTEPPSSFENASNISNSKSSNIFAESSLMLLGERLGFDTKNMLKVDVPPARSITGVLAESDIAAYRQAVQGTIYFCTEGIQQGGTPFSPDTTLGTMLFTFTIVFAQPAASDAAYDVPAYVSRGLSLDVVAPINFSAVLNNCNWRAGSAPGSLIYVAGPQNFDLDITMESIAPFPPAPVIARHLDGTPIAAFSVFSFWVGLTTTLPVRHIIHFDGLAHLTFGDSLTFDPAIPAGALITVELDPKTGGLSNGF